MVNGNVISQRSTNADDDAKIAILYGRTCIVAKRRKLSHCRLAAWQGRLVLRFTISTLRPPKMFGKSKSIQPRSVAVPGHSIGRLARRSRFSDDGLVCNVAAPGDARTPPNCRFLDMATANGRSNP